MASDHKGEGDVPMKSSKHSPQQVPYHSVVFILTPTVVSMEVDILLAEPMYHEEVMEHADDGIRSLTTVNCLIDEVVDLSGNSLTAHSKDGTLPRGKKVHGPWLLGVVGVEYLLGHVERVVSFDGT